MERVIEDARLRQDLRDRVLRLQTNQHLSADADLVLVAKHELEPDGFADFWSDVGLVVAPNGGTPVAFPTDGDFDTDLSDRVREAKDVLIFALGAVSGASLQRALVGIQDARKGLPEFELHALVVHARPATAREWETVENSYRYTGKDPHLHFGWKSLLPDRSPLREEAALLRKLDLSESSKLDEADIAFVTSRLELCQGEITQDEDDTDVSDHVSETKILWGVIPEEDRLTPNSLYGQDLDAITTYVAVGSAMAAALARPEMSVPELRVFDIAALTRSYYDPIILSCFFRWLRPHEAFWGWTAAEATATAMHIIDRAEGKHRKLLIPEMLLAAAQGKLTAEAAGVVTGVALQLLTNGAFADEHAAIRVGLMLTETAPQAPETEALVG
jgi:hypothetical protein